MSRSTGSALFGLASAVVGVAAAIAALRMGVSISAAELGTGLFPMVIGLCLALSGLWQVFSARSECGPATGLSKRQALKAASIFGGLVGYVVLTEILGYLPATLVFLFVQFRLLGSRGWAVTGGVAVVSALAFTWVFRVWIQMPLPHGILGFMGGF